MARKTKEDAEQTRIAILESALLTFYEKGFSRTTFDEIAKRINLTKGAVYWHFKNKVDIIAAIIKYKFSQYHQTDAKAETIEELKNNIINRAQNIQNNQDVKDFLFFMIYRMEWSEVVLNNVWNQICELCEIPDNNIVEALERFKDNGQIKKDTNIINLSEILICFMRGCVNKYIAGRHNNADFITIMSEGFDAIMNNVKSECK